jgi:hypothetical protein
MSVIKYLFEKILNAIDPQLIEPSSTNLFVGKIIDDGSLKCEVVAHHNNNNNMHIKILKIEWAPLGSYLDVGKVYPVYKHSNKYNDTNQVWEIASKHMKRDTSQVLLWFSSGSWSWDIDS